MGTSWVLFMNFHSEEKSWDRYLLTIERLGWDPLVTGGIHISILGVIGTSPPTVDGCEIRITSS